jgi:hypothetical protein
LGDSRRFLELAELYLDDDLSEFEAKELRTRLEGDADAVKHLHGLLRDQVICRTALRPADPQTIRERTQRMVASWRIDSGQIAAQAVFARVDRRRRISLVIRWGSVAAAALVVLLIAPFALDRLRRPMLPPDERAPAIAEVVGDVRLGALPLAGESERLVYGSPLTVGAAAHATLVWADGTRVVLTGGSVITRQPAPGQRLRLDHGAVEVVAAKRPSNQPLEIICPDATVRVVGTRFAVTVADGHSSLAVEEGLVRFQRESDGVSSLVGAGQRIAATRLPLPPPVLMSVDHLAALRSAIAAGRDPWASTYAALKQEVPAWLAEPLPAPTTKEVPHYQEGNATNPQHTAVRRFLNQLLRPMVGLALVARIEGDVDAEAAARARLAAATTITLTGPDAGTLGCDMLAVSGLQAADLLRGLPSWQAEDDARIAAWIAHDLQPLAEQMHGTTWISSRWRGVAAMMSIAAWRGDQQEVLRLMQDLRTSIATQFNERTVTRLSGDPIDDQTLFQSLSHALYSADIARVAGGDITPPPAQWNAAVTAYLAGLGRATEIPVQQRLFARALSGPEPWRTPQAGDQAQDTVSRSHAYCWYFPTLLAYDPRW